MSNVLKYEIREAVDRLNHKLVEAASSGVRPMIEFDTSANNERVLHRARIIGWFEEERRERPAPMELPGKRSRQSKW